MTLKSCNSREMAKISLNLLSSTCVRPVQSMQGADSVWATSRLNQSHLSSFFRSDLRGVEETGWARPVCCEGGGRVLQRAERMDRWHTSLHLIVERCWGRQVERPACHCNRRAPQSSESLERKSTLAADLYFWYIFCCSFYMATSSCKNFLVPATRERSIGIYSLLSYHLPAVRGFNSQSLVLLKLRINITHLVLHLLFSILI